MKRSSRSQAPQSGPKYPKAEEQTITSFRISVESSVVDSVFDSVLRSLMGAVGDAVVTAAVGVSVGADVGVAEDVAAGDGAPVAPGIMGADVGETVASGNVNMKSGEVPPLVII
tara:strand:+ start:1488 stop:1829 length:342 start_codon:yes stop_codon:yes gene_type:complete